MKKFSILLILVLFLLPNLAFGKAQEPKQNKQLIQPVEKVEFEKNIEGVKNEVEQPIIKEQKEVKVSNDNQIQLKDVSKDVEVKEDFKEEKQIPTKLQEVETMESGKEINEFNENPKEEKNKIMNVIQKMLKLEKKDKDMDEQPTKEEERAEFNIENKTQLKDVSKDVEVKEDFKEEKQIPTKLQEVETMESGKEINSNDKIKNKDELIKVTEKDMENGETFRMENEIKIEIKDIQENEVKEENNEKISQPDIKIEERRSRVANTVQEMLNVAERNQGIGEQIKNIAQTQNQMQEETDNSLKDVKNRSNLVKFLIGPDYKKIDQVEEKIEQHEEKIEELKELKNQLENSGDEIILEEQIKEMEQVKEQVKEEVKLEAKSFSLFGWLNRAFSKKK